MRLETSGRAQTGHRGIAPWQPALGVVVIAGAGLVALVMAKQDAGLVAIWLLGICFGVTLQRGRFCFASAFRDLFLFGQTRNMRGILAGLAVATVGFALIMYNKVPTASFGFLPDEAHVLPLGISLAVAGLLFGLGMVLAGGCVSGSIYRMAEGYLGSWVSFLGILAGLGLLSQTWNWWWTHVISKEPKVWLPSTLSLGYGGAVALTLLGLVGVFLFLLWWEARSGLPSAPDLPKKEPQDTFTQKLGAVWRVVFVRGWPVVTAGAVLGGLNVLLYTAHMPWGVTGEFMRWANGLMDVAGFAAPAPMGLEGVGGCTGASSGVGGVFTHTFAVSGGLFVGSLAASLLATEFKLRVPRSGVRYVQSLGGGVLMGYGAGLGIGCTIGAFFSAIPSLSLSGWFFGLALAAGAFLGVQVIKRIP